MVRGSALIEEALRQASLSAKTLGGFPPAIAPRVATLNDPECDTLVEMLEAECTKVAAAVDIARDEVRRWAARTPRGAASRSRMTDAAAPDSPRGVAATHMTRNELPASGLDDPGVREESGRQEPALQGAAAGAARGRVAALRVDESAQRGRPRSLSEVASGVRSLEEALEVIALLSDECEARDLAAAESERRLFEMQATVEEFARARNDLETQLVVLGGFLDAQGGLPDGADLPASLGGTGDAPADGAATTVIPTEPPTTGDRERFRRLAASTPEGRRLGVVGASTVDDIVEQLEALEEEERRAGGWGDEMDVAAHGTLVVDDDDDRVRAHHGVMQGQPHSRRGGGSAGDAAATRGNAGKKSAKGGGTGKGRGNSVKAGGARRAGGPLDARGATAADAMARRLDEANAAHARKVEALRRAHTEEINRVMSDMDKSESARAKLVERCRTLRDEVHSLKRTAADLRRANKRQAASASTSSAQQPRSTSSSSSAPSAPSGSSAPSAPSASSSSSSFSSSSPFSSSPTMFTLDEVEELRSAYEEEIRALREDIVMLRSSSSYKPHGKSATGAGEASPSIPPILQGLRGSPARVRSPSVPYDPADYAGGANTEAQRQPRPHPRARRRDNEAIPAPQPQHDRDTLRFAAFAANSSEEIPVASVAGGRLSAADAIAEVLASPVRRAGL